MDRRAGEVLCTNFRAPAGELPSPVHFLFLIDGQSLVLQVNRRLDEPRVVVHTHEVAQLLFIRPRHLLDSRLVSMLHRVRLSRILHDGPRPNLISHRQRALSDAVDFADVGRQIGVPNALPHRHVETDVRGGRIRRNFIAFR